MSTPISAAVPYCSTTDFFKYVDERPILQLIRNDGTQAQKNDALNDPILTELLLAASGEVESACLVGNKYTPTDLQTLTGASAAILRRIVAGLAADMFFERRLYVDRPELPVVKWALAKLELIRDGQRIFGLQEVMNAGNSQTQFLIEDDLATQNFATYQATRFFGTRSNRGRFTP